MARLFPLLLTGWTHDRAIVDLVVVIVTVTHCSSTTDEVRLRATHKVDSA